MFGTMLKRVHWSGLSKDYDFRAPGLTQAQLGEPVERGEVTFLFNNAGDFIHRSEVDAQRTDEIREVIVAPRVP